MRPERQEKQLTPALETASQGTLPKRREIFRNLFSVSPFALQQRESGVPTITRPAPAEESIILDKLKKKRKGILLKAGVPIALVGLLTAGAVIYSSQEEEPRSSPTGISRDISNPPAHRERDTNLGIGTPQIVTERKAFDNTAIKESFTNNNSVAMDPEQYEKTSPQPINGDSVVIPLPVEFPKGQTPIAHFKREKGSMFGGQRHINGRLENGEIVSDGTVTVNDVIILDDLPVGSVFLSPWEGEIQFATSSGYENPDGSLKTATFTIYITDDRDNKVILTISTVKVRPLIEPSRIEYEEGTNHTKPLTKKPIKVGSPIVEILTTNHDNPYYDGQVHISAISQVVEENGQRRGGPAGIEIDTTPEGQAIRLERK